MVEKQKLNGNCPHLISIYKMVTVPIYFFFEVCFMSNAGLAIPYDCDGVNCGPNFPVCYNAATDGHFTPLAPLHWSFTYDHYDFPDHTLSLPSYHTIAAHGNSIRG